MQGFLQMYGVYRLVLGSGEGVSPHIVFHRILIYFIKFKYNKNYN